MFIYKLEEHALNDKDMKKMELDMKFVMSGKKDEVLASQLMAEGVVDGANKKKKRKRQGALSSWKLKAERRKKTELEKMK